MILRLGKRSRKVEPWETVYSKEVQPLSTVYDADEELQVLRRGARSVTTTVVFEGQPDTLSPSEAVVLARMALQRAVDQSGKFNFLMDEGWRLTVQQRGSADQRMEVEYTARPALARSDSKGSSLDRNPPFLALLARPER